jgi:hypothetical protein
MEGTVHIDAALTNISVAYRNGVFIAERVLPVVPVLKQSDKYYVHGKEAFNVLDDRRSAGSEARLSRWSLSNDSFFCGGHALKDYVPREDTANADPQLDLLSDTTEVLTQQVLLNQEVNLVAALVAGLTGVSAESQAGTHWDDDDVDPLAIIKAQILEVGLRVGIPPNVLALSAPVWSAVSLNANVRQLITGAGSVAAALVTPAQVAAYLGIDEILVGSAVKNTANQGQTATLGWVWGEYACLFYRPPNPGRKVLSLGYTFQWTGAFGGSQSQFVNRYFWQPNLADVVEVHKYYDQKLVDTGAGALFTDCLS